MHACGNVGKAGKEGAGEWASMIFGFWVDLTRSESEREIDGWRGGMGEEGRGWYSWFHGEGRIGSCTGELGTGGCVHI